VGVDHVMVAAAAGWRTVRRGTTTRATVNVVGQVVRAVPTTTIEPLTVEVVTASTVHEPE
jgi:hypothetical protein